MKLRIYLTNGLNVEITGVEGGVESLPLDRALGWVIGKDMLINPRHVVLVKEVEE